MKQDWRTRLRNALEEDAGKTMRSVSLKAGLGATFVRDALERNRTPSHENARKIEEALGVTYGAIFDPKRDWAASSPTSAIIEVGGSEHARIPIYDIRFAAGFGATNSEDETPIDYYMVSMAFLRTATDAPVSQIAIFQSDGDSMEPTINSRDWVFVDRRKNRLTNPGIYALIFEGDGFLKRASQHLENGSVTLISDNPKYPSQTIKKPERLQVVGRVFLSMRRH